MNHGWRHSSPGRVSFAVCYPIVMRTILDIDEELLRRAEACAVQRHTTLAALVESALRAQLNGATPPAEATLPTWDGGGFPEGVDWDSNEAVLDYLDAVESRA